MNFAKPMTNRSDNAVSPELSGATRRQFLAVVSGGTATALAGSACSSSDACAPQSFGDVSAGAVADVAVGVLRVVPGAPVFIGRDDQGIYAMTNTCTHMCCTAQAAGTGAGASVACPCHGSRFDRYGAVTNGPANAPLVHFQVDVDASGTVTVRGGMQVPATTRTAVAG
jgi:nitrite reductase/ring-hydroxylating ferredoxin subunit